MATECGSFLIGGLSLGSENPKEIEFFSFQQSDSKYSLFKETTSSPPSRGLGVDASGVWGRAFISPPAP